MLTSANPLFMDVIEGRFSTPSGNYFWHRKYQKVEKLLARCVNSLDAKHEGPRQFVDIGCGQGIDLFRIHEFFIRQGQNWQLTGIDADPTSLYLCTLKKEGCQANNIRFASADITQPLPFEDASMDILYCSEVIEHLVEPEALLGEFRRVLKPTGYLILTTPNEPNIFQRTYWSAHRRREFYRQMEALREGARPVQSEEVNAFLFDHVSLRTIDGWNRTLEKFGFVLTAQERGAITYGGTPFLDNEWIMSARFLMEAVLDLFPPAWTYRFSDQLIGLYHLK